MLPSRELLMFVSSFVLLNFRKTIAPQVQRNLDTLLGLLDGREGPGGGSRAVHYPPASRSN